LYEEISAGTKVSGSFQVSTGGFLDIDVKVKHDATTHGRLFSSDCPRFAFFHQPWQLKSTRHSLRQVTGPDERTIYSVSKETEGRFTYIAAESGTYRACFGNFMSTVTV
jgi:hypothetical protein